MFLQKRRSNRKIKRKKYEEDGEARLSDEDMKVIVKAKKSNNAHKEPAVQLFVVRMCNCHVVSKHETSGTIILLSLT